MYSSGVDTVDIVFWNMTGDPLPKTVPATEDFQEPSAKYNLERMISEWRTARPQYVATTRFAHLFDQIGQLDSDDVDNGGDVNAPVYCTEEDGKLVVIEGMLSLAKCIEQLYDRVSVHILTKEQVQAYSVKAN